MKLEVINQGRKLQIGNMVILFHKERPICFRAPGIGTIGGHGTKSYSKYKKVLDAFGFDQVDYSEITGGTPFNTIMQSCITAAFLTSLEAAIGNFQYLKLYLNNRKGEISFIPCQMLKEELEK
jgi:hypothetical protein